MSSFACTRRTLLKTLIPLKLSSSSSSFPASIFSFSQFSLRPNVKQLACNKLTTKCSLQNQELYDSAKSYQKPSVIQWKKELSNSIQLIGIVGSPVRVTHLGSGKVIAWTSLAVHKSQTDTTSWFSLEFWDELAHVAHQHVVKGHEIYVSGHLVSNPVEGEDGMKQTYYKPLVILRQLNFVERNYLPPVASYSGSSNSVEAAAKFNNSSAIYISSTQELWQAFFANPVDWWDNRKNKRNPKSPDFKHKHTGEALWLVSKYNPPWLKSQLEILDSRMQAVQNKDERSLSKYLNGGL